MVKKIILFVLVLMVAVVPVVSGDENSPSPTPYVTAMPNIDPIYLDGGIVELEYKIYAYEVEIGGEFIFDITLYNVTNEDIEVLGLGCGFVEDVVFRKSGEVFGYYEDSFTIAANETVTLELKGVISDNYFRSGGWYKKGSKFYYYFNVGVDMHAFDTYYYVTNDEFIPLEVTNIYDGSEYINYQWKDNNKTMFVYDVFWYDRIYEDGIVNDKQFGKYGFAYYELEYSFNTDVIMFERDMQSGGTANKSVEGNRWKKATGCLEKYGINSDIADKAESAYKFQFKIDDKYYGVEAAREYTAQYFEKPDVEIDINQIANSTEGMHTYQFTITNSGDMPIDNMMVMTHRNINIYDEEYEKHGTINAGDSWNITGKYENEYGYKEFIAGYFIDDIFFWWRIEIPEKQQELSDIKLKDNNLYTVYQPRANYSDYEDEVSPVKTPVNTPLPTPTQAEYSDTEDSQRLSLSELVFFLVAIFIAVVIYLYARKGKQHETN